MSLTNAAVWILFPAGGLPPPLCRSKLPSNGMMNHKQTLLSSTSNPHRFTWILMRVFCLERCEKCCTWVRAQPAENDFQRSVSAQKSHRWTVDSFQSSEKKKMVLPSAFCACARGRAGPFQRVTQNPEKKTTTTTTLLRHNRICLKGFGLWHIRKYNNAQKTQWPFKLLICAWKDQTLLQCFCRRDGRRGAVTEQPVQLKSQRRLLAVIFLFAPHSRQATDEMAATDTRRTFNVCVLDSPEANTRSPWRVRVAVSGSVWPKWRINLLFLLLFSRQHLWGGSEKQKPVGNLALIQASMTWLNYWLIDSCATDLSSSSVVFVSIEVDIFYIL